MWTDLDFKTSTKSQVTPHAAPGKLESSASHGHMKDEALAVLAEIQVPFFPSWFPSPWGHCPRSPLILLACVRLTALLAL